MVPDWLDDEGQMQDMILSELDEPTLKLFKKVMLCHYGLLLLRFLTINEHTLLTIEDIAFNMNLPYTTVERCLQSLLEMKLARRMDIVGVVLFGLTEDEETRKDIHNLVDWQVRW